MKRGFICQFLAGSVLREQSKHIRDTLQSSQLPLSLYFLASTRWHDTQWAPRSAHNNLTLAAVQPRLWRRACSQRL